MIYYKKTGKILQLCEHRGKEYYMNNSIFTKYFTFRRIERRDGFVVDNHRGTKNNYVGWILSGEATFETDDQVLQLREGDVFYVPAELRYRSVWSNAGAPAVWYTFNFDYFPCTDRMNFALQRIPVSSEELAHLIAIAKESPDRVHADGKKQDAYLPITFSTVGHLFSFLGLVEQRLIAYNLSDNNLILKATEYMRANPWVPFREVAKFCAVSETTLYNTFKSILHKTPNDIRKMNLCEAAKELLVSSNKSVEEISAELGFSSSSYFRKIFKLYTGTSPNALRHSRLN